MIKVMWHIVEVLLQTTALWLFIKILNMTDGVCWLYQITLDQSLSEHRCSLISVKTHIYVWYLTDKAETSFKNESSQTWSLDHFSCRKLSVASGGHLDAGCGWVHYPGGFAASQQTGSPGLPEDHAAGGWHHRRHSVQSQTRSNGESVSAGMGLM